ncbi:hypothetical protein [Microbacterium sp. SS28]|uniref:hypothetical protein n=1 Tax=Microbacterium sp. SS28 TaxID=2919948 RepID=UPI001FA993E5|nr:hypothetical protein [Microbacterium sp. SS28]
MSFHSLATLEGWLAEFLQRGYEFGGEARVLQQDGAAGANTGLIAVSLADAGTIITIQPETRISARWVVTIEALDSVVSLDAPAVLNLAAELSVVSALCAFLEAKSLAFEGIDRA